MTDDNDLKVATELAIVSTKIEALTDIMNGHVSNSEVRSKEMYDRLVETEHDIKDVVDRMDKAEPLISQLDKWRERGIGAFMVVAAIGSIVGAVITAFWKAITD